jgi:CheY-like chemotaxis protein
MAKILIVDDRALNRKFLVTLLGYGGYQLSEAADGGEALVKIRAEHPDLVITDFIMPAMDGFQLVQQIRSEPAINATDVIFYRHISA